MSFYWALHFGINPYHSSTRKFALHALQACGSLLTSATSSFCQQVVSRIDSFTSPSTSAWEKRNQLCGKKGFSTSPFSWNTVKSCFYLQILTKILTISGHLLVPAKLDDTIWRPCRSLPCNTAARRLWPLLRPALHDQWHMDSIRSVRQPCTADEWTCGLHAK